MNKKLNKNLNKNEIIVCFVPSLKWRMSSGARFGFRSKTKQNKTKQNKTKQNKYQNIKYQISNIKYQNQYQK